MADDVARWLEALGLGKYSDVFAENDVDFRALPALTDDDLKELGVSLGHRRILQQAIDALSKPVVVASEDSAVPERTEAATSLAAWERHPGERKPATILFADITGSTALTEKLDAEETHDLLNGATQHMCDAVKRHRGTLCRFMGDGVMAMFGAPIASERHAIDACEAALEMQTAVESYGKDVETKFGSGLRIRVGLHSGEIVVVTVGEGDNVEYDASGPTVPIAARMEQAAKPGEVYLTAATNSLAAHAAETEALQPVSVKGISQPIPVFALRRVRPAEEVRPDTPQTPFVGRRAELNQFSGMLDTCLSDGRGQTVYVRGESGIGKTRLVGECERLALERGFSCHRGLVLPFGVGKGQDAIRSLVRSLLQVAPQSGKEERQRAAEIAIGNGTVNADRRVFLNDLLDLPQPMELRTLYNAMENATRNEGKQKTVSELLRAESDRKPVFVVIEDVHWGEPITLAHLATLTSTVADCPALLVMTSRVDGDPLDQNWRANTGGSPLVTIDLGPLRKDESIALISKYIDSTNPMAQACLERAAGNPLFLEQLLQTAKEGSAVSLPDSIQSLVLARIDRLAPEHKRALQAASVIGQRFTLDALRFLLQVDDYQCRVLVDHNLVRSEGAGYLFAHALIQEGVYGSILKSQRRALHLRCAEWFADHDSTLYAEHLGHAGDPKAAEAYLAAAKDQAGQERLVRAVKLTERGLSFEPVQSIRHQLRCFQGELLHDLNDAEASINVYREALEAAGDDFERCDAWMGIAAGLRVKTDYHRALELLEKAEPIAIRHGLNQQLSRLHHLRGNLYFPLGRTDACHAGHQRALEFARAAGSVEDEARALGGLGDAEYARGRMRSSYESLEKCVEMCRQHGLGRIEVANQSQMANCMVFFENAQKTMEFAMEAVEAAVKVGHRRAEMNAVAALYNSCYELADSRAMRTHAERGLSLAEALGARTWISSWLLDCGLARYLSGDSAGAEALILKASENEAALVFVGGWLWGSLALVTDDPRTRARALAEGERRLKEGTIGSGYLIFYRYAMEACLNCSAWEDAIRYAQALEDFTRPEPLPPSDLYIARGRALAAFGQGKRDEAILKELHRLRDQAQRMKFKVAIRALDEAISAA